jgi:hypothetical protein
MSIQQLFYLANTRACAAKRSTKMDSKTRYLNIALEEYGKKLGFD